MAEKPIELGLTKLNDSPAVSTCLQEIDKTSLVVQVSSEALVDTGGVVARSVGVSSACINHHQLAFFPLRQTLVLALYRSQEF